MLKYLIGFAALVAIVASASVVNAGCHEVTRDKQEVCLKANAHYPCLMDLSGKTMDILCYKHHAADDTYEQIGDCRIWLQQVPCNDPECKEPFEFVEVDCCCMVPSEPKVAE